MFIVIYPADKQYDNDTFKCNDLMDKNEAKSIFKRLYLDFKDDLVTYNISAPCSSKNPALADFIEDFNLCNLDVDGSYCVYLNLTEEELEECANEAEKERNEKYSVNEGTFFFIIEKDFSICENFDTEDDYDFLMYLDQAECSAQLNKDDKGYIQVDCKKIFPFRGEMVAEVYGFKDGGNALLGSFEYDNSKENFGEMLDDFMSAKYSFFNK